jgi:hypothetical protein
MGLHFANACPKSTSSKSIFERALAYVYKIPGAIEGSHGDCQTLAVANALIWDFALSQSEALTILREYNVRCSPPWTEAELNRKLQSAEKQPHSKPRGNLLGHKSSYWGLPQGKRQFPSLGQRQIDPAAAVEKFLKGFRCSEVDLREASPLRPPDDWTKGAVALLENLYKPGEKINFVTAFTKAGTKDGTTKANPNGNGETVERDALLDRWHNLGMPRSDAGGWFRMNPVDGAGVTDSSVTAYRFALVECDSSPLDLQLSFFARLALPVSAILASGGRSLHAWAQVDALTSAEYQATVARLFALLARFGVDGKNKNPSRLSRLPGVIRTIGALGDGRQRLLYLNPAPQQKPILCLP